jgi:hypothetical protein
MSIARLDFTSLLVLQVPWEQDKKSAGGTPVCAAEDLRYYSRGLFNHPIITRLDGVRGKVWSLRTSKEAIANGLKQASIGIFLGNQGCFAVDTPAMPSVAARTG